MQSSNGIYEVEGLVFTKLSSFGHFRNALSTGETQAIEYWKEWLDKFRAGEGPQYSAKRFVKDHLTNASRVSHVLVVLVMLVTKATALSKVRPRDSFVHFQAWWERMTMEYGWEVWVMESIPELEGLVRYMGELERG